MGANVSRHNSKGDGASGLSAGRRSQSSGSIYNRQRRGSRVVDRGDAGSEKGYGSSLPGGYFDLTGDINSQDQDGEDQHDGGDGSSLDEDTTNPGSRIPPLGDASGGGGAPLHWKFSDGPAPPPALGVGAGPCRINGGVAGHPHHHHHQVLFCDQGYGSERSPEEECLPPLLGSAGDSGEAVYHQLELHSCYPFITPESTFSVSLAKGSRGLGLSVTGGIDSGGSWPGLIRVKRLFPHQPAAACGCLNVGDLILEANGVPLTGLTNYEALEVLRTAPAQVELRMCRPPPDVLNCVSPISEVPPPPPTRREQPPSSLNLSGGITSDDDYHGEFEITMRKMQGSLGFTLRKEDDSALGHYIRALVREPALKDGRIRPGDKIIAVNDKEISEMSHEEAVQFLRQCGDLVKLRLYRDAAQTPIATLSPTEMTPRTSFCRKAQLRQEAVDMLNDIAVRKLLPNQQPQSSDTHRSSGSPSTSPRRIRRALTSDSSSTNSVKTYATLAEEQFHEALLHDGVYHSGHIPLDEESFNSLFIQDDDDDPDRPNRPASLDLYNPNQTPVAARKPKFNFSLAHNAYELNNLDAEILDAPNLTYNMNEDLHSGDIESTDGGYPHEPASMPHIPTESTFSYKNPAYQSAHPTCTMSGPAALPISANENGQAIPVDGGGTLPSRGGGKSSSGHSAGDMRRYQDRDVMTAPIVSGEDSEVESGTIRRRRKPILKESKPLAEEEPKILAIELNRGWNSRLGFSLQGAAGVTYVSAVHADSVAARDGRIKPGDRVIKVNDENVDHLGTNEIIDLLRIVRGPVCIVVSRGKATGKGAIGAAGAPAPAVTQDCLKSNAVN